MQAVDFLHCDHVIKIQCRITPSCRIAFALGVWFGCFASLPLQELQQRNISYFNKQKQKILMFCFALIFNVYGNWSTPAKFFTMRVQSELAFNLLDLNTAFTKLEGSKTACLGGVEPILWQTKKKTSGIQNRCQNWFWSSHFWEIQAGNRCSYLCWIEEV